MGKKFWEALQAELGYEIISIEYMGMWPGYGQRSRYAIQVRKNPARPPGTPPLAVALTDLTAAELVSKPSACREARFYIVLLSIVAVFFALVTLATYFFCARKSQVPEEEKELDEESHRDV